MREVLEGLAIKTFTSPIQCGIWFRGAFLHKPGSMMLTDGVVAGSC